jgi:ribosomal protein S18 acetylase RimI-like enzyme
LNIRECLSSDIDKITEFTLALHLHESDQQLVPHANFSDNLKKWLESELGSNNSLLLLAEKDQKAAGFVCASSVINDNGFLQQPLKGIIQLLWVEPEYRKRNIAQQLVNTVELCFKESGINYVECSFMVNNSLASHFWTQQGYIVNSVTCRKILG